MPKIAINGVEYEAKNGQTIIEVADEHGINIPRFCYHPGLTVAGNCRICLVDVEKAPKPMIACGTPVMDGMVVQTESEKALWAREGVMEFLLLNHPLDCPICDKAGECMLQWYSVEHGPGRSRLVGDKEHYAKNQDIGKHIVLDQERCILCSRCVRFTDEITGTSELGIYERGVNAVLDVVPGKRLDNDYSGCVTDVCPVGALTLKEFRFKARVWFLEDIASICPGCSRGCNVNIGARDNVIARVTPRTNTQVNDYWICDVGRLIYQDLQELPRVETPRVHDGQKLERATWADALKLVWDGLHKAASSHGEGAVAALASARCTNEEIWVLRRLITGNLRGIELAFPEHIMGEDDGILLNADRTPNRRGAQELCGVEAVDGSALERLRVGVEQGVVRALVVVDEDPLELGWTPEHLARLELLVVLGTTQAPELERLARVVLPRAAWSEEEGTYVNAEGRVQRLRSAVRPAGEARPGWKILARLGELSGWTEQFQFTAEILGSLAEEYPAFRGLHYHAIGHEGMPLPDAPEARRAPIGVGRGGNGA